MKFPLEGIPPLRQPSQRELSPSKPDPVIDAAIAEMLELGALKAIPTNSSRQFSLRGTKEVYSEPQSKKSYFTRSKVILSIR